MTYLRWGGGDAASTASIDPQSFCNSACNARASSFPARNAASSRLSSGPISPSTSALIRSMNFCSISISGTGLAEAVLEQLPRRVKTRLHGLLRNFENFADLHVAASQKVFQDDDRSVVGINGHERGLYPGVRCRAGSLLIRAFAAVCGFLLQRFKPVSLLQPVDRFVKRDPVNPAEKSARWIEAVEVLVYLEKHGLGDVACVFS